MFYEFIEPIVPGSEGDATNSEILEIPVERA
jgi:hypothetical protein